MGGVEGTSNSCKRRVKKPGEIPENVETGCQLIGWKALTCAKIAS